MPEIAKPLIYFIILIFLFITPIFFIHDYASDTSSNISTSTLTRLAEVNTRAGNNFYQIVRSSMMEMNAMTKYLAQQNCGADKAEVLAVAPLFYAHGVRRFSIVDEEGKGFDGGGTAVDVSRDPVFLSAREGKTHITTHCGADRQRLLIIANPLVVRDSIKAVVISEFPAAALETSMETWAFSNNTYNLVMDASGRALFLSPPPGKSMDDLFARFSNEGLPSEVENRLKQTFADFPQESTTYFDNPMNLFVATTPVERFGWQMVSLMPKGAGNAAVSQQSVITNELVWRLAILAGIIITFVLLLERNASRKLRRQQEDYRTIIASISGGVLKFFSPDGTFLFVSPNYKKMLGFTEAEFDKAYGNSFAATIYEKDRDPVLRAMRKQMKNGQPIDVEYRTRTKSGALVWLYHKGAVVNIEHGHSYIQSIVFDITQSKEAALSKRISDERHQFILEQHDINIFEQNLISGYFSCSPQWLRTFGTVFNILETDAAIPLFPDDQEKLVAFQREVRLAPHQHKCTLEARLRDAGGEYRWFRIEASSIANTQGAPIYAIGIITDIDQQKSLELQLRTQATRDGGTGMRNKVSTEKAVSQFLETHESPLPQMYAMFMIDFDNFKGINDRFGHAMGDKAIYDMAQIIRRNFRGVDIVGRIGGDEFLVFCTERMSLHAIRERALMLVEQLHTQCCDQHSCLTLTASVGVACCPRDGTTYAELFNKADKATYAAKKMGRNRCVFYKELNGGEPKNSPMQ
ncbi:diguanylate cyclase [Desulfovibrio desulfuricans]|uniref:Diguanylate cyclase n=1 Tax=Desulfovibrio desulfuricans TaxID=876 RepID=A0A4P7UJT0_DESDE|nr:diguanylate cyclase [Desulfovibrio desulfuricans]QCC84811.1 diguanylate cyclase [Desulfovibrio desulfuricans]